MNNKKFCGYIAFIGLPNAGKSTLLNACVKAKLAGVSKRPQTTRNRILGVETLGKHQLIFVDTPGLQRTPRASLLTRAMQEQVWATIDEADVICYLIDVAKGWTAADEALLRHLLPQLKQPIWILATKGDSSKKQVVALKLAEITAGMQVVSQQMSEGAPPRNQVYFREDKPYVISAKRPAEVSKFKEKLAAMLPEGPWLFAADEITDASEQFILAELIREQLFRKLADEVPFGCGVVIEKISAGPTIKIQAVIMVDNPSHKKIVIGKGGEALKVIGTLARHSIEQYYEGKKTYLELYVRVEKGWTQNLELIQQVQKLS